MQSYPEQNTNKNTGSRLSPTAKTNQIRGNRQQFEVTWTGYLLPGLALCYPVRRLLLAFVDGGFPPPFPLFRWAPCFRAARHSELFFCLSSTYHLAINRSDSSNTSRHHFSAFFAAVPAGANTFILNKVATVRIEPRNSGFPEFESGVRATSEG